MDPAGVRTDRRAERSLSLAELGLLSGRPGGIGLVSSVIRLVSSVIRLVSQVRGRW